MRTSGLVAIVGLLALCVAFAATNPTRQDYQAFLEAELGRALAKVEPNLNADPIREMLKSQGPKLIESITRSNTDRRNYGLFSVFETRALGASVSFLGIWRTFIPLSDVNEVVKALRGMSPVSPPTTR
jgi:hypothetical protein